MSYRIMIVEDDYWAARELATEVRDRGASVTGPTSSIPKAIEFLQGEQRPDVAVLDIQLRAFEVFSFADMLTKAGIPFVFATGYEKDELPSRFADVPHFVKPISNRKCIDAALALASTASVG